MKRRSPTAEGFKSIFRHPSVSVAEISWRWSFGFAATLLLAFSFFEYLNTLPVTNRDLLLLGTRQSFLIAQAVAHMFRGSGPRLVFAMIVVGLALAVAWIVAGSLGRAATVQALLHHLDTSEDSESASGRTGAGNWHPRSIFAIHFFRAATTLAAIAACVAAIVLGGLASPRTDPSPGSAFLIFLMVAMLAATAWSFLNWFLSLASVFVVSDGQDTFGAMSAAADLIRNHPGMVFAPTTWFGLAHVVAFFVASSAVAFPLAFGALLPPAVVFGGVLLVLLLYFAAADFLYAGRLAAYVVAILDQNLLPEIAPPAPGIPPNVLVSPSRWMATEDDILSDVPEVLPPPEPSAN